MNNRGMSLVEMLIVITIITILSTIGTINFNEWQRKALVERYTKELYADMQEARMRAAYTKVRQGVDFAPRQVTFRTFANEADVVGTVVRVKTLPLVLAWSNWVVPAANRIVFDTRGLVTDPIIKIICFTTTDDTSYDAIIMTPVITNMGKVVNKGIANACTQNNVVQK